MLCTPCVSTLASSDPLLRHPVSLLSFSVSASPRVNMSKGDIAVGEARWACLGCQTFLPSQHMSETERCSDNEFPAHKSFLAFLSTTTATATAIGVPLFTLSLTLFVAPHTDINLFTGDCETITSRCLLVCRAVCARLHQACMNKYTADCRASACCIKMCLCGKASAVNERGEPMRCSQRRWRRRQDCRARAWCRTRTSTDSSGRHTIVTSCLMSAPQSVHSCMCASRREDPCSLTALCSSLSDCPSGASDQFLWTTAIAAAFAATTAAAGDASSGREDVSRHLVLAAVFSDCVSVSSV